MPQKHFVIMPVAALSASVAINTNVLAMNPKNRKVDLIFGIATKCPRALLSGSFSCGGYTHGVNLLDV